MLHASQAARPLIPGQVGYTTPPPLGSSQSPLPNPAATVGATSGRPGSATSRPGSASRSVYTSEDAKNMDRNLTLLARRNKVMTEQLAKLEARNQFLEKHFESSSKRIDLLTEELRTMSQASSTMQSSAPVDFFSSIGVVS
eukprot:NODE_3133_length_977_cov_3.136853_g2612_i0.p2 GENE.NODE_3133_length_977_cov_3.136853_g2612_i0~~NODE_3133_length_977_cov_3.136853_g2612_i0.p2  ORF type:complete len:152 (-),score=57.84 NODE_3133_length_977_cov_3.136853_g2612_i0:520-942(-)